MIEYKTIALAGIEQEVKIKYQNCDIRNDSVDIIYVSTKPEIVAGADGVLSIPSGGVAKLLETGGTIYMLGTGSVQLCSNTYDDLVFKSAPAGGGGSSVDEQARTAITAHTDNSDIHLFGRRSASIIVRPRNGVTCKARIDWNGGKLIFDNTDGILIATPNKYFVVSGTTDSYEIPFVSSNAYNFLVGSTDGLKFIPAEEFIKAANWEQADQKYYFGYVHTATKGYEFNFEVHESKSISVIGDSISTFAGYIPEDVPAANIYYKGTNAGVTNVHKMWWQIAIDKLGYERNTINAYGGSRVSNTMSETNNGMARATALDNGTDPDIIIVYLGVNDFNGKVPLGDYDGKGIIPENTKEFGAAYAKMLHNIQGKYKLAKVYCMTLPTSGVNTADIGYPEANSVGLYQSEFNERIRAIARAFNCGIIEGESCGITAQNAELTIDDYGAQGEGWFLHPNSVGQSMLAEAVIKVIK